MRKKISWAFYVFIIFNIFQSCKHSPEDVIPIQNDTTRNDSNIITKHPCDADSVYFERDIQPIFTSFCAGNDCHSGPQPKENIDLTSYLKAISTSDIKPFNPLGSKVYQVLKVNMPPAGPLAPDKMALIKKWIEQGAKNLWCDDMLKPCDTTNVTYNNSIVPILKNTCISCHGSSGGVNLSTYAGVKMVIDNGKLWDAVNHLSGPTKAMPNSSTKLSACNLRQIKIWINAGAPEN